MDVEHALELGGISGLDPVRGEQEGRVGGVEEVDASDGNRPQGVAMVGVTQADEGGAQLVLASELLPVLEGHLERDLGRA